MGHLENGVWLDKVYDSKSTGGRYVRDEAAFRNWITTDGSAGPSGGDGFRAERNRYHLYVSYACPWAHRTLIFRALKGLQDFISLSVVNWHMAADGWTFDGADGVIPDPIHNARCLHEVYTASKLDYTGRVTVPVLWDKNRNVIVSNESSEIIRMLNSAFDSVGAKPGDYYPKQLRPMIDELNQRIYPKVNNGVYRAGFATNQTAYEEAVFPLFKALDWLEGVLREKRYLGGDQVTEADWRLFTTLVRFDPVYVTHFKCNIRRLSDYHNLSNYLRDLYQHEGVAETVNLEHIKGHYFVSHSTVNPSGVVPVGPIVDLDAPHDRQ